MTNHLLRLLLITAENTQIVMSGFEILINLLTIKLKGGNKWYHFQ